MPSDARHPVSASCSRATPSDHSGFFRCQARLDALAIRDVGNRAGSRMRSVVFVLTFLVSGAWLAGTAIAGGLVQPQLAHPSAGCAAANSGSFDLNVAVELSGASEGMPGSGIVDGFGIGDVLTLTINAEAGRNELSHAASLVAIATIDERPVTMPAWEYGLSALTSSDRWSLVAQLQISQHNQSWKFFTSALIEGEGLFSFAVRCKSPAVNHDGQPIS